MLFGEWKMAEAQLMAAGNFVSNIIHGWSPFVLARESQSPQ